MRTLGHPMTLLKHWVFGLLLAFCCILPNRVAAEPPYTSPPFTHRYRVVIEIEADGQLKTGSIVVEVSAREYESPVNAVNRNPSIEVKERGEAAFIDLGKGRHVVAMLGISLRRGADPGFFASALAWLVFKPPSRERRIEEFEELSKMTGRAVLPREYILRLLSFSNLDDPLSFRFVRRDELGVVFGPDISFKQAWIELTAEPVVYLLDQKLPWLPGPGNVAQQKYCKGKRDCLSAYSFGIKRPGSIDRGKAVGRTG
jgi:hypothetical protein